jgi:hypothetical protein
MDVPHPLASWLRHAPIALAFGLSLLLAGCSDRGEPLRPRAPEAAGGGGVPETVSFAADIQPILTTNCVPCHGPPAPQNHLDLSAGVAWANLVNVTSFEFAPAKRVVPSDTAASVLYHKLEGDDRYGPQMPFGGSLQAVERDAIRAWILEGARNN